MFNQFKAFVKKYKLSILLALLFSFICFGFMLTNFTVKIDEETWLLSENQPVIWLYQGRFVIWLFDILFTNNGNYAPFFWSVAGILLWNASGVVFAWSLLEHKDMKKGVLFAALAYYSSLPFVVGEIFGFTMYVLQIGLAALAVSAAWAYTKSFITGRKRKDAVIALLLLIYSFGTYQAFVGVYITAVAAYCAAVLWRDKASTAGEGAERRRAVITGAVLCVLGVAAYYAVNAICAKIIGVQGYLTENYLGWSECGLLEALSVAVLNVGRVLFAIPYEETYVFSGEVIRVLTILFVCFAIYKTAVTEGGKKKLAVFVYSVFLCVAPFVMYIALGTYKTHGRMLLGIPLLGAVQLYLIFGEIRKVWLKRAVVVVAGWILFENAYNMNLIYCYSTLVYNRDCTLANDIMYDIRSAGIDYKTKPVAFIGMIEQDEIPTKESGTLGASMFEWDDGNNQRIVDFMKIMGYDVTQAYGAQLEKAIDAAQQMQTWPQDGSIAELDDVIVVKLSEPTEKWYEINNADAQ